MPSYTYKAKDQKGQSINGTLEAESRGAVNARLQAMGYFPIDIQGGSEPDGSALKSLNLKKLILILISARKILEIILRRKGFKMQFNKKRNSLKPISQT